MMMMMMMMMIMYVHLVLFLALIHEPYYNYSHHAATIICVTHKTSGCLRL